MDQLTESRWLIWSIQISYSSVKVLGVFLDVMIDRLYHKELCSIFPKLNASVLTGRQSLFLFILRISFELATLPPMIIIFYFGNLSLRVIGICLYLTIFSFISFLNDVEYGSFKDWLLLSSNDSYSSFLCSIAIILRICGHF